jgi:hypothetical protein
MSSRNVDRHNKDMETAFEAEALSSSQEQQREQQRQLLSRALEQAKDSIGKSVDEARSQIPRYTQVVNDFQEQTIQAIREIVYNYLESQKEIINSFQSAWIPQIEAANRIFTTSWVSPRHLVDIYANAVGSIAENTIAATRLTNNMMLANIEAFKTSMRQAKDNVKELSGIGVNAAKSMEQTVRNVSLASYPSTTPGFDDTHVIERRIEEGGPGTEIGRKDEPLTEHIEKEQTSISNEGAAEKARRSGMTKGAAGAAETGSKSEQVAAGTNKKK